MMPHKAPGNRSRLAPLFDGHRHLKAIRQAVLEGRLGQAWVDPDIESSASTTSNARVARLELGCYNIIGGNADAEGAERLLAALKAPTELIYPAGSLWRDRIRSHFGGRVTDRPMEGFRAHKMRADHLRALEDALPAGYALRRLDEQSVREVDSNLEPNGLQTYIHPAKLVSEGLAWGVFSGGIEGQLVSLASSYALSSKFVEVAIATHPTHRGRGLAAAIAARFCLEALERGLEPCWHASNPISKRLARRLGFESEGEIEILYLT